MCDEGKVERQRVSEGEREMGEERGEKREIMGCGFRRGVISPNY